MLAWILESIVYDGVVTPPRQRGPGLASHGQAHEHQFVPFVEGAYHALEGHLR